MEGSTPVLSADTKSVSARFIPPRPPIFDAIARLGGVAEVEMRRAFNLGVGYVFVVPEPHADAVLAVLDEGFVLGRVVGSDAEGEARVAYA